MEILIVDDDLLCRELYRAELERGGYIVLEACDGLEALDILRNHPVDLITLDLAMPNMGGFEFCDRLWSRDFAYHYHQKRDSHIPILVVTANVSVSNRVKSLRRGISEFLIKGFPPGTLLKRVNQILKPANPFTGLRTLIISDAPETKRILGRYLTDLGLEIQPMTHSSQAVEARLPIAKSVDVIFMDTIHANQGRAFCQSVREEYSRYELPIIALMPQGPKESLLEWFAAGASDFLIVPFSLGELKAKLGTALTMIRSPEFPLPPDATGMNRRTKKVPATTEPVSQEQHQIQTIFHNVGNILNSVVVSCALLRQKTDHSHFWKLKMAHQLLSDHLDDLPDFLGNDPKGMKLIPYMLAVGSRLDHEYALLTHELRDLDTKVQLIQSMVQMKPTSEDYRTTAEICSLEELITPTLQILSSALQRANVSVSVELEQDLLVQVPKNRMIHVLINLIKNAIEAMGEHQAPQMRITGSLQKGKTRLSIQDNGHGLSREQLSHLFEHGYTTKLDGHGIGLAFCQKTIREMGGDIQVESEGIGAGCHFTMLLPSPPGNAAKG